GVTCDCLISPPKMYAAPVSEIHGKTRTYVKPYVFKLILWKLYYFSLRVFTGTRMSTRSLLNLNLDPQVTRVTGHSDLTDLKLADLPTSKLIGSHELLGVVSSPSTGMDDDDGHGHGQ